MQTSGAQTQQTKHSWSSHAQPEQLSPMAGGAKHQEESDHYGLFIPQYTLLNTLFTPTFKEQESHSEVAHFSLEHKKPPFPTTPL